MTDPERLRHGRDRAAVALRSYARATTEGPSAEVAAWYRTRGALAARPRATVTRRMSATLAAAVVALLLARAVPEPPGEAPGRGGAPGEAQLGAGGAHGASGAQGASGSGGTAASGIVPLAAG